MRRVVEGHAVAMLLVAEHVVATFVMVCALRQHRAQRYKADGRA